MYCIYSFIDIGPYSSSNIFTSSSFNFELLPLIIVKLTSCFFVFRKDNAFPSQYGSINKIDSFALFIKEDIKS